ncbi:MAG: amidohydrolase family protein [Candidatus Bathyarchaeota archaeon]|nr:amidohydrolase family protein [Candidatus Bathyarchaeota archaeon]
MIVDGHTFLGKSSYMEQTKETIIANMDKHGVDASVVVAPPPGPIYDKANQAVAEAAKDTKRLIPLYHANPFIEDMAEKVDAALSDGFKGVKISPTHDGYGIGGPLTDPVIEKAREHDAPVYIHSGDSIFCPPENVARYVTKHPDVNFVTTMTRRATDAAMTIDNLYLMTYSFPVLAFQRKQMSFPVDRLIFTSDAPLGSLEVEMRAATISELSSSDYEKVMGGNLLRIIEA